MKPSWKMINIFQGWFHVKSDRYIKYIKPCTSYSFATFVQSITNSLPWPPEHVTRKFPIPPPHCHLPGQSHHLCRASAVILWFSHGPLWPSYCSEAEGWLLRLPSHLIIASLKVFSSFPSHMSSAIMPSPGCKAWLLFVLLNHPHLCPVDSRHTHFLLLLPSSFSPAYLTIAPPCVEDAATIKICHVISFLFFHSSLHFIKMSPPERISLDYESLLHTVTGRSMAFLSPSIWQFSCLLPFLENVGFMVWELIIWCTYKTVWHKVEL
jgi:hypothetical protein